MRLLAVSAAAPEQLQRAFISDGTTAVHDLLHVERVLAACPACSVMLCCCKGQPGMRVALKSFSKRHLDAASTAQVMAEVALLSELQHTPHVLPLWLALDDGVQLHVVTPYCAGGDLRQALCSARGTPLPEAAVRDAVVAPLLAALAQLHARGYVHRDVKPENIFLTQDGAALLGDFGMAVHLDLQQQQQQGRRPPFSSSSGSLASCATDLPSDASGSCVSPPCSPPARRSSSSSSGGGDGDGSGDGGSRFSSPCSPKAPLVAGGTPAYTAPEVVAAAFDTVPVDVAVTPQNDVYSLGVVIWECLSGSHPLGNNMGSAGAVLRSIATSKQLQPGGLPVSEACKAWLAAALARDPAQRASAAQLLQHEWMRAPLPQPAGGLLQPQPPPQQPQRSWGPLHLAPSCPDSLLACTAGGRLGGGSDEGWGAALPLRSALSTRQELPAWGGGGGGGAAGALLLGSHEARAAAAAQLSVRSCSAQLGGPMLSWED